MSNGSNFMFGVRMIDLNQQVFDLNAQKRYFDIYSTKLYFKGGLPQTYEPILLEKCTRNHWAGFPNIL